MNRSRPHSNELCFPTPPARIDRTFKEAPLLPAVAATYLSEIQRWRESILMAMAAGATANTDLARLTPRARSHFAFLLDTKWNARTRLWALDSAYDLTPFPDTCDPAEMDDTMAGVMAVLRWRAGVVTYLSDVWDVLGKPALEKEECLAISAFLQPARMEGRCILCLTEFDSDRAAPEDHGCVMLSHAGAR